MNDDYLWDGSGEPDPEIQKLESTLGRFRHEGQVPDFPETIATQQPRFWQRIVPSRWSLGLRLATATAIVLVVAAIAILRWSQPPATGLGWDVQNVAGRPRVESNTFGRRAKTGWLGVGQTLVTDSRSQATLSIADVGTVNVEPNTRLRSLAGGKGHNQLALDRGTIHAFIWASPGQFTVETPSAVAVDLGAGILRTKLGWVGFKLDGHEAFIPAGAVCATRPKVGPGTPYFEDASPSFREALAKFDFGTTTPEERNAELGKILAEARQRDALTIWHLLARVHESQRGSVYDRLATLVPPPARVTRDGILHLDQKMMDSWWNQLDLGDISLWRTWERSWAPAKS
jgi:hypothetical protein